MIHDGQVKGSPLIAYVDTQSNIESLSLDAGDEGAFAYATDINKLGSFDGSSWTWFTTVTDPLVVETVQAVDGDGLKLLDDGGGYGIHVNDGGLVSVGHVGPAQAWIHAISEDSTPATLTHRCYDGGGGAAGSHYKSRGSFDSPTAVQAADTVGGYNAYAYDGSSYDIVGRVRHIVSAISAGDIAGYIEMTVTDTSGVETDVVRIKADGVGIFTTSASERLHVEGNILIRDPENNAALILSPSNAGYGVDPELYIQSSESGGGANSGFHISRNAYFRTSDDTYQYIDDGGQEAVSIHFSSDEIVLRYASSGTGTVTWTDVVSMDGSEQTVTFSGNIIVGDTSMPGWDGTWDVVRMGDQTFLANYPNVGAYLTANVYYDGSNWKRVEADYGVIVDLASGVFTVRPVDTGSAGASVSPDYILVVDHSGIVGVNEQSPQYGRLEVTVDSGDGLAALAMNQDDGGLPFFDFLATRGAGTSYSLNSTERSTFHTMALVYLNGSGPYWVKIYE